jgi:hypothetical protein
LCDRALFVPEVRVSVLRLEHKSMVGGATAKTKAATGQPQLLAFLRLDKSR